MINNKTLDDIRSQYNSYKAELIDHKLESVLNENKRKIVVLDDDPTGVQTVNNMYVYTDWSLESIENGFIEENNMFFILTNSRGLTRDDTKKVHREIATNIAMVSKKLNRDFLVISRSDSTLRGHYPLETTVLKDTLNMYCNKPIDGEIIFPFFMEGNRYTIDNIHYILEDDVLVPVSQTEFAKDKTFGYTTSHLGKWIEEKSLGQFKAEDVTYITMDSLRNHDIEGIVAQLETVDNFNKVVVNAIDYVDVKVFTVALLIAIAKGKKFIFRTAACFTKVIGGVADRPLLTKQELVSNNGLGGLLVIGSHVKKTSQQLEELKGLPYAEFIEFNQHLIENNEKINREIETVTAKCQAAIKKNKLAVVYTRRERFDIGKGNKEEELKVSVRISDAVTRIVECLEVRPAFIIAKGGITSSDIGVKGLGVKKALVAGQISPGVPVWITRQESKFPGMALVIFPGNVGTVTTLREIAEQLMR